MPVIAEKKILELIPFESIIKRCPVCLKDTEQQAYYAQKPDMNVEAETPTEPSEHIIISPKLEHEFEWYVLATCGSCNKTYRVMGVPKLKVKDVPKRFEKIEVSFVQLCCDLCYNEEYHYKMGEIFINLSSGSKVYLCERHANEVEEERKRIGSYDSLIKRISAWGREKEKALLMRVGGKEMILKRNHGYTRAILSVLSRQNGLPENDLIREIKSDGTIRIKEVLDYLASLNLIHEKQEGVILRKTRIYLTEEGRLIAGSIKE